jgi:hypothetical protein
MPDQHPIVHAWEARPGSGERGTDGRQAGEFSLDEALYDSFRFNLSRQIVGEVRGREVIAASVRSASRSCARFILFRGLFGGWACLQPARTDLSRDLIR